MASFVSSATTGDTRKHAWTNITSWGIAMLALRRLRLSEKPKNLSRTRGGGDEAVHFCAFSTLDKA